MSDESMDKARSKGGRPRKFREASRPVTVTLPQRTLEQLAMIDPDRARAIVKAVESLTGYGAGMVRPLETREVCEGKSVILVGPNRSLQTIPFLRLVEILPGRNLLVMQSGTPIDSLEVAIMDALERLPSEEHDERTLLQALRAELTRHRQQKTVMKAELLLVDAD